MPRKTSPSLDSGRLGTSEFDVLSDADLLVVHGDDVPLERAAAAATSIITLLNSYTSDGIVFTVDLRLRPHGRHGELTTSPSRLAQYFRHEAEPWEALSYTKLRFIAGSAAIASEVSEAIRHLQRRFSATPSFRRQAREMRSRLEVSVGNTRDFKKGWGGFYDIDFIASILTVERAAAVPPADILARLAALKGAGHTSDFRDLRPVPRRGVSPHPGALPAHGSRLVAQNASRL